jgi:hypothetical protein
VIGRGVIRGRGRLSSLVKPLLHFVIPFASLRAVGTDLRKAVLPSLIALTPDLDVYFHIHGSENHSIIILAAIAVPLPRGFVLFADPMVESSRIPQSS